MHKPLPFHLWALCLLFSFTIAAQDSRYDTINPADSIKAAAFFKQAISKTYSDPSMGKKLSKESIRFATMAKSVRMQAWGYNNLGLCHRNLSEYDSALVAFTKAAELHRSQKDLLGLGQNNNNIAMTWFYLGDYEKANALLLEVIKDAEAHSLNAVLANAYQNLGIINDSQERFKDALDNFILAEKYHGLAGNLRGKAGAANNQAAIYAKHLKQYDKAIAIYKTVIPIKEKTNDEKGVGICYNNMAEAYYNKGSLDIALETINKAITIRKKINDSFGLCTSYNILGKIYLQYKKYPEAERYASLAIATAKKIGAKKELSDNLKLLAKIHEANRDITNAYDNLVAAVAIKDSLLNKENFARMAELETRYESEKKEREILQQRAKIAENQIKIDQKNTLILGAFALTVIAVLLGYLFFNRQKLKTVKLEKEAELKEALLFIETQNKLQEQRLQISRDLHDNIGSQLTFIISSLDNLKYSFDITDTGLKNKISAIGSFTKATITELRDTIWAMNKEEISLFDLKTRISNFIENAKAASKGISFRFEIDRHIPDNTSLSSLKGINLYRVIQESVNNALKHADASIIQVGIAKSENTYTVTINDNGSGFEMDTADGGNGLANIRKRVADCGGTLAIVSAPEEGTKIIVTFK